MWRTKSSYTSEGLYRSIAAVTLSLPRPLLLLCPASVFRDAATVPFAPGGSAFLSFPFRGGGDLVSVGGVVDLVGTWECRGGSKSGAGTVGFRSGLGLLCCRLPSRCVVCVFVCAGVGSPGLSWTLGQRPAEMGARDPGFDAIFASDWWEWVGSGSQTAVAGEDPGKWNCMWVGCWGLETWTERNGSCREVVIKKFLRHC